MTAEEIYGEKRFKVVFVRFSTSDITYMFEAPRDSYIEIGDKVIINYKDSQEYHATVIAEEDVCFKYESDREAFNLWCTICSATLPLERIKAVVKVKEMKYEEDEK